MSYSCRTSDLRSEPKSLRAVSESEFWLCVCGKRPALASRPRAARYAARSRSNVSSLRTNCGANWASHSVHSRQYGAQW